MKQFFLFFAFLSTYISGFSQDELKFTSMCCLRNSGSDSDAHVFRVVNSSDTSIYYTSLNFNSKELHGRFLAPPTSTTYFKATSGNTFIFNWEDMNGNQQQKTLGVSLKDCSNQQVLSFRSIRSIVPIRPLKSNSVKFPVSPFNPLYSFTTTNEQPEDCSVPIVTTDYINYSPPVITFTPTNTQLNDEVPIRYEYRYKERYSPNWIEGHTSSSIDTLINVSHNTVYIIEAKTVCNDKTESLYSYPTLFVTREWPTQPTCSAPINLKTSAITSSEAQINWEASNSSDTNEFYTFRYKIIDDSVWNYNSASYTNFLLENLNPNSNYEWQLKAQCGDSISSTFSDKVQFTTLPKEPVIPIAHWPLDDQVGMLAEDILGSNDGVLNGFIPSGWQASGKKGGALKFNGILDFVFAPNLVYAQDDIEEVSIALWIKTQKGNNQGILSLDKSEYYSLEINGSLNLPGHLSWSVRTNLGILTINSQQAINDDTWHLVVATFNKGKSSLYIDGVLDYEETLGSSFGSGTIQQGVFVGVSPESLLPGNPIGPPITRPSLPSSPPSPVPPIGSPSGAPTGLPAPQAPGSFPNFFDGQLDEIRIYDQALNLEDIQNLYEIENNSDPIKTKTPPSQSSDIWMEAECAAIGSNWRLHNTEDHSVQYIAIKEGKNSYSPPPTSPKNIVSYTFNVIQDGAYYIFFRTLTPGVNNDSFWVRVDNNNWIKYNNIDFSLVFKWKPIHDSDNNDEVVSFQLSKGHHKLEIIFREDHSLLDKIYISLNDQIPSDAGPEVPCNQISFSELSFEEELGAINSSLTEMKIFPNPASNFVNIQLTSSYETGGELLFINTLGKIVSRNQHSLEAGINNFSIPLYKLSSGLYIVKYLDNKSEITQRLIITK